MLLAWGLTVLVLRPENQVQTATATAGAAPSTLSLP
jgi:hypothetical protein